MQLLLFWVRAWLVFQGWHTPVTVDRTRPASDDTIVTITRPCRSCPQ